MITIHRDGTNYGPYDENQLHGLIASGNITLDDMAWRDGESDWAPLRKFVQGGSIPPPPPAVSNLPEVYQERGVYVGPDRVTLGTTTFATKNIGGVSIKPEERRIFWPILGLIFGGLFTAACFFSQTTGDKSGLVMFGIIISVIPIWCGVRIFSPRKVYLEVAASGGVQTALESTDGKRIGRIAAAIQRAITA